MSLYEKTILRFVITAGNNVDIIVKTHDQLRNYKNKIYETRCDVNNNNSEQPGLHLGCDNKCTVPAAQVRILTK